MFDVQPAVVKDAGISDCGNYRYWLTRTWDAKRPFLGWVMLNPSTADADIYALRSTDPKALLTHPDPVGPENDDELALAAYNEPVTMLAWGANAPTTRAAHVARLLWMRSQIHGTRLAVLGWTKAGAPAHPLYVRADQTPEYCDEGELFE
jgi:hypothetical protein